MKIIDAENQILGRLATYVAKMLLLGESVVIVNSEKALITGPKSRILAKYKQDKERGIPLRGPYFPKRPEMILKRTIRGMLPYKQEKGASALKRLKCYVSLPEEFVGKEFYKFEDTDISNSTTEKTVDLYTVSKFLGAKL
ncbi:MAG: 50S ribosomal protein L13 [Candidatus Woesearchaeota archaeon]